jgi:hypothetical protein
VLLRSDGTIQVLLRFDAAAQVLLPPRGRSAVVALRRGDQL